MQLSRLKFLTVLLLAIFFVSISGCQSDSKVAQPRQVDYDLGNYLSSIPRDFPNSASSTPVMVPCRPSPAIVAAASSALR